jgi:hypothetical protein
MMSRVHSRGLSPEEGSPLRRVATTLRARSALAVPPGFGGLLRIDTARACCIPHPVVGFAKFQAHVAGASEEVLTGEPSPLASHPSKHFPRQQPYRVTAADTFSPFHRPGSPFGARRRARRGLLGWQPTSRCCSTGESVACGPALPPARCSMLPWALIPLKASPLGTVPTALQRRPPSSAPRRSGEHRKESLGRTGPRPPRLTSSEEGVGRSPTCGAGAPRRAGPPAGSSAETAFVEVGPLPPRRPRGAPRRAARPPTRDFWAAPRCCPSVPPGLSQPTEVGRGRPRPAAGRKSVPLRFQGDRPCESANYRAA